MERMVQGVRLIKANPDVLVVLLKCREEFFEICVGSPAQTPSAIQWDALKKLVLVQCISRGKVRLKESTTIVCHLTSAMLTI